MTQPGAQKRQVADRAAWMGETRGLCGISFKKTKTKTKQRSPRPGTYRRVNTGVPVPPECLSTSSTTSRWKEGALQKLPLGEMPAPGGAGLRTAHTCGDTLQREQETVWLRSSHPQLSTGGSEERPPEPVASESASHKDQCPGRSNGQKLSGS